ncbi:CPBP family intramembrane glutamic endopeptidase [Roseofilum casamattae]|uniref:CPBP family intramembrane metalloprotease n=1 Tax=Roseofilum casamattae BLCC-M143 TaxID=3022442 RepID=A0ABT7C316_9CYAN|nr:CPBP family intramembrane metalloprotease [Roseofilum casamattae]MDJ1185815.1 CPBP family intramembrane metalloprotease [Roseofilum casamattae BLCC-M143]
MRGFLARASAIWRILILLVVLLCAWLPFALPIYRSPGDPNLQSIAAMGLLYLQFLLLAYSWTKWIDRIPHPANHYGVRWSQANQQQFAAGLCIGIAGLLILFTVEELCGWIAWQPSSLPLAQLLLEGSLVAFGIGLAEELFFRGWLLSELRRNYSPRNAAIISATVFAILHFIKPLSEILRTWVQFPGLVILGLTLAWGRYATGGRLGLSIGLHTGLVGTFYIINVGNLIQYTQQVPTWITGIDRNPLAGIAGLVVLGAIAIWLQQCSSRLVKNNG